MEALWFSFAFAISIILPACQTEIKEVKVTRMEIARETIIETVVETVVERQTMVEKQTIVELVTPTPAPEPEKERRLVICTGQEPDTLFKPATMMVTSEQVLSAIYDGPIDSRSFGYQPVILDKLPSLADGDTVLQTVTVEAGSRVVDDAGEPVILEDGVTVRPAGCHSSDCAVVFDGIPVEMEQMVVTFKLKEGILWSDGEPLTTHDSVYGFKLASDPDLPLSTYTADRTASYEASDSFTTVWTGLPGYSDSTYFDNFWHPFPEHAWADMTALELQEAEKSSRKPLGWGPFVIEEWIAGEHVTLRKNELYWRSAEGLPRFDRVIYRFVGENSNANIAALLAGECDIVDQTSHLDDQAELLLELQASGQVKAMFVTGTLWELVVFGINPVEGYERPDFFEDVRVRRAIAHCADRQAVVDTVMYGQSIVLDTYIPPLHPLFNPDVPHYEFDVAQGAALLEAVGWIDDDGNPETPRIAQDVEGVTDGTLLEFNYWTTNAAQRQQATQVLQASLAECGIKVNLEFWNPSQFLAAGADSPLFGRRFDAVQFGVPTGVEPPCEWLLGSEIASEDNAWTGVNISGWSDLAYDAACKTALQSLPGTLEHEQNHREAQRIFAEQLPLLPLYLRLKLGATRPDMQGFIIDPTEDSAFWNIEEFELDAD
jgi:peptide/nickel transport system substrate-binding protein